MRVATAAQMANLDGRATSEYGIPPSALMERAGRQVARVALMLLGERGGRQVVVLCGKGNNGGDGLVAARDLRQGGFKPMIILAEAEEEFTGEARRALEGARAAGLTWHQAAGFDGGALDEMLRRADVIIDALFGTGFRGPARDPAGGLIEAANRSGRPIVAVDLPSGLEADTGRWIGPCIHAAATVTMGVPKVGLLVYPGAAMAGSIYVADIGYPVALADDPSVSTHVVTTQMITDAIPTRRPDSHKGTYGRVLILAGSVGFTGAAVLAAKGALRAGAGLVTVGVPQAVYPIVAAHVIEAMPAPLADAQGALAPSALARIGELAARSDVIAVGPGLSPAAGTRKVVEGLLALHKPLVLDADALNVLAGKIRLLTRAAAPVVITPHPGELGRLVQKSVDDIQDDRLAAAREAAAAGRCVVLLKGARSVVAAPDGEAVIVPTGNPGMATGGMGDVLTGAIAALIGQGLPPLTAAYTAAYLHGLAADLIAAERGQVGILASEVADRLPAAIQRVANGQQPDQVRVLRD